MFGSSTGSPGDESRVPPPVRQRISITLALEFDSQGGPVTQFWSQRENEKLSLGQDGWEQSPLALKLGMHGQGLGLPLTFPPPGSSAEPSHSCEMMKQAAEGGRV